MWTEGQTDMTNLIVAFRNFYTKPKNVKGEVASKTLAQMG